MDQLKKENKELNEVVNKALEDMAVFHARAELETHKRIEVEKKAKLLMNKTYGKCIKQPDQNDSEEQLEIRRKKRIKFVNDHKEEIEKLKEQPTFSHVKSYYYNTTPRFRYDGYLFPYNTFSKDDLKIECKIRDLKWGGKKTDLLKRLTNPLLSTHKAKKPYHPRLMFVAWLKRAAYMEFEDEEAEYQEIGKFHRGWWEYMEAYVEYEDYYAIVVKAGQAFGAFDY